MRNNFIKYSYKFIIAFLFVFSYENTAYGETNFVKTDQADITLSPGEYENGKATLGLNFKLQDGWHIYWHIAGDAGFPPKLEWTGSSNLGGVEFKWPTPIRIRQELAPDNFLESYVYEKEVTFPLIINAIDASKPLDINLHVSYAICAETCIPGDANLSLNLQPGYTSAENLNNIKSAMKSVPQENGAGGLFIESVNKGIDSSGKDIIEVNATASNNFSANSTVFITGGEHFAFYNPDVKISGNKAKFTTIVTPLGKHEFKDAPITVTLVNNNEAVELITNSDNLGAANIDDRNLSGSNLLLSMLIFALLGGLILNIMPCVLPVLSIKLLGVIKHGGGNQADVKSSFLFTAIGIISSFLILAIITIWLKEAGEIVGWGLHFQQPYFIIALVVILTLFAANMWGLYEINFNPLSLLDRFRNSKPQKKASKKQPTPLIVESRISHFMSGMLVTILATPCTAPFVGVAVGFAITRGAFEIITIFLSMGIGLAFPYLLFSLFPALIVKLPKPGKWMIIVKKIMSILLAISAVWLIWVLSSQLGNLAAIILLILCVAKILKLWAANHYEFINKIKVPLIIFIIILAFIIPIRISNHADKVVGTRDMWEDFHPEHIANLVQNGKIVFVDVTANWCLTCKVNKLVVLDREEIKNKFLSLNIVAMKADWTNRDKNIAKYLMEHKRAGIPFNIVYGPGAPNGIIISELLSTNEVLEALDKASGK